MAVSEYGQFELDGYLVVCREGLDQIILLNNTAAVIWQHYQQCRQTETVITLMAEKYAVSGEQLRRDVVSLVEIWHRSGLLGEKPVSNAGTSPPLLMGLRPPAIGSGHEVGTYGYGACRFSISMDQKTAETALGKQIRELLSYMSLDVTQTQVDFTILGNENSYQLARNGEAVITGDSAKVLQALVAAIIDLGHQCVPWLAVLHAGAVGAKDGCLIFPGVSGSGKTTLVASLAGAGREFLADDVCVVDAKGMLRPCPSPLSIKQGSWELLSDSWPDLCHATVHQYGEKKVRYVAPSVDNSVLKGEPYPVGALINPRYDKGIKASLSKMNKAEMLAIIIEAESLVCRPGIPAQVESLVAWIDGLSCYRLTYGDMEDARQLLQAEFPHE